MLTKDVESIIMITRTHEHVRSYMMETDMIDSRQYDDLADLGQKARDADRQHGCDSNESIEAANSFYDKAEALGLITDGDERLLKSTLLESIDQVMGMAGEELEKVQA